MNSLNIVMIGCVDFSLHMLKELYANKKLNIVAIVTKAKSDFNSDFCSLKEFAVKNKIPFYISTGKDETKIVKFLEKFNFELGFCLGWSHMLSLAVLNLPKLDFVGYHPAKLPFNRGRHPVIWALVLGLKETASTFFIMNKFADQGHILDQRKVIISKNENAETLYNKLISISKKQINSVTKSYLQNKVKFIIQNKKTGNKWRKRTKEDGIIDWRMPYESINNLVRALYKPYTGAVSFYKNKDFVIWNIVKKKNAFSNIEPGKVLKVSNKYITVKCGDSAVVIKKHTLKKLPKEGDYLF
ncbi:formyltransferase family protein [Alphaproteobacteria bacterium]|nr:formyltransferase family protein [Alphaproteobacteria bacterium]